MYFTIFYLLNIWSLRIFPGLGHPILYANSPGDIKIWNIKRWNLCQFKMHHYDKEKKKLLSENSIQSSLPNWNTYRPRKSVPVRAICFSWGAPLYFCLESYIADSNCFILWLNSKVNEKSFVYNIIYVTQNLCHKSNTASSFVSFF